MLRLPRRWRSYSEKRPSLNGHQTAAFETLKEKLVTAPILIFPDWSQNFHVHVDASAIALGTVLAQLGEGNIDHPISFASRKLSYA